MYSATIERNQRGTSGYNMRVSGHRVGRVMRYSPVAGLVSAEGEEMKISPLLATVVGATGIVLGIFFGRAMR